MPQLLSKKINNECAYAVWHIKETEAQLLELINEQPPEGKADKRSEWIVTRILVSHLCEAFGLRYQGVKRLESGKPVLNGLDHHISISHSFPLATAYLHLNKPCGIDIEWPRDKLLKIERKFLNELESKYAGDTKALCKIWIAKEVLFKIHGRKSLSFKDEMVVSLTGEEEAEGKILKNGFEETHKIHIESIFNYLIGYNL